MPQAVDEAGNIFEVDAQGNPVRWVGKQGAQQSAPQGGVFSLPPNPRDVRKDNLDADQFRLSQAKAARDASNDAVRNANSAEELRLKQIEFASKFNPDGTPKASPDQLREDRDRGSRLNQLISQINRVQQLFDKDINPTSGFRGVQDYLPTDENARFDTAGAALSQQGLAAFRVPGTGTVTDRDAMMFDRANLPTAATRDSAIEEQLRGMRARVDEEAKALGLPPVKWQGAMGQTFLTGGNPQSAAAGGATEAAGNIPPAMQDAHRKWIAANIGNPNFADAYVQFRQGMDAANGFQSDPDAYRAWAQGVEKNARGGTTNTDIAAPTRKLSAVEQLRNNAVNNPFGAAVAGVADAGGFGIPSALAGDQMRALGDAQGLPMALGQIAGSIGATGAIGKGASMGLNGLARGAPRLAASARNASPFMKSLGADTAYAGVYGANTGQDPLMSAAFGVAGSTAGQGIGKAVGAGIGGIGTTRASQVLRNRGIPTTIAQQMGGWVKGMEDKLTSVPGVGDLINSNRLDGMRGFNRAAIDEAGRSINATATGEIGETGVQGLMDQISGPGGSYDQAVRGVRVPLDRQFGMDLQGVARASRMLPPDIAPRFASAMDNRVGPIAQAGEMTGDTYQQAVRGIKGYRSSAAGAAPGFEGDYRDALTMAQNALTGQMQRGGGAQVVDGLARSDQAYKMAKVLEKAQNAAKNGTGSGELQVFTPAQLNTAAYAAKAKYGGDRPFARLADAGQRTLPSQIPDSGTAGRLAAMALPGALGGTGAAAGYAMGDAQQGAGSGLAIAGLLAAMNTKAGQKFLQKALIDRGSRSKAVGRAISKKKRLLGTATLPFLVEGN